MQEIIVCHSFFSLTSFSQNYLLMQTIRGILLIVSSFIMSISSVLRELKDTNQPLSDGIILEPHTLNFNSQSGRAIGFSSFEKRIIYSRPLFNQLLNYIK